MAPRKRTRAEMEATEPPQGKKEPTLLQRIRNMWEFSSVMQYIYLFGKVVKIDEDFDVEDFEEECLKPGHSEKLEEIGLTLLKWISSHRGLTYDIWDEYVRRQYVAKAPERNPYGDEEEPKKFRNFDIFQRIRVLHQLTVWTFWNPDRIREKMPEHQKESEQIEWRMEPFGWDSEEREYFVLDDNRMYRRSEPPLPAAPKAKKSKANTMKARAARRRASKRRKLESEEAESEAADDDTSQLDVSQIDEENNTEADTYGGYKWECVAITLNEFNEFLESITKTKDLNEKELRNRIMEDVLPVIEAAAEKQRRKQERRERDLMLMEKLAGAKRSSRLADKQDRERRDQEEAEAARKKAADLAAAHREQEKQLQMEDERRSRMMTREQRIKDREYKRLLMEEELARDAEEQKLIEEGEKRGSERHLRERIESRKKELEDLQAEEDWTFDCSGCGKHGKNYDDGSHSVACERCNVWQHSKCLGVSKSAAEKDDFHFICGDCRKVEEEAKRPKIMLKFGTSGQSSSPPQQPQSPVKHQQLTKFVGVDIPKVSALSHSFNGTLMNGLPQTQSPIPRPKAPTPNSQLQSGTVGDVEPFRPSLQQPQKIPMHGPSSPSVQPANTVFVPNSPKNQQTSGGNLGHHYQQQSPAYLQNAPHQSQMYSRPPASTPFQSTPQPSSAHGAPKGASNLPGRIPSPVLNRPMMSPTQGNPEVGPIAGVPGSSPSAYHPALFTPNANGNISHSPNDQRHNGYQAHDGSSSPRQSFTSQSPNPQHFSGLSPIKHRVSSPLPPPSNVPEKQQINSMSPPATTISSSAFNSSIHAPLRSVSGTPIFPPAEKLAPSPEQINREPMPTPSKQPSPPVGGGEFRRTNAAMDQTPATHMNGNTNVQHNTTSIPSQSKMQSPMHVGEQSRPS